MKLIKDNIVAIFLFLLTVLGGFTWSLIQKGSEAELKEFVSKVVLEKMTDPKSIAIFLAQDQIKNFAKNERKEAYEQALKEDEGLVNFETRVSMEMGVFPDISSKEIGKMYKDYLKKRNRYELMPL